MSELPPGHGKQEADRCLNQVQPQVSQVEQGGFEHEMQPIVNRANARKELSECQQQAGESASAFAARVSDLVKTAYANEGEEVQSTRQFYEFLHRMSPLPVGLTKAMYDSDTLHSALDFVKMFEALLIFEKAFIPKNTADSSDQQASSAMQMQKTLLELATRLTRIENCLFSQSGQQHCRQEEIHVGESSRSEDKSNLYCHYCERQGHLLVQCRVHRNAMRNANKAPSSSQATKVEVKTNAKSGPICRGKSEKGVPNNDHQQESHKQRSLSQASHCTY